MDPATLGLIANVGSQFLGGLVKKRRNPFESEQYAALNKSRARDKYFDSMLKRGESMAARYEPTMQKMADMSIESATKPLTNTDIFKGVGPAASLLQQQGDAARASATQAATSRGLGGGVAAGMGQSANNAINSAIASNIGNFASNYELSAPQRLAQAQGIASGMYGQGMGLQQGAMAGSDANMDRRMAIGNQINQFNQAAEDEANAMTAGLGSAVGSYFGNQAAQRNMSKQLASQEKMNNDYLARLGQIGAIGYIPGGGTYGHVNQGMSKYNVGPTLGR
jgi:hypothetical protein